MNTLVDTPGRPRDDEESLALTSPELPPQMAVALLVAPAKALLRRAALTGTTTPVVLAAEVVLSLDSDRA